MGSRRRQVAKATVALICFALIDELKQAFVPWSAGIMQEKDAGLDSSNNHTTNNSSPMHASSMTVSVVNHSIDGRPWNHTVPNLLIAGCPKCSTTSVDDFIGRHPGFCRIQTLPGDKDFFSKELWFFSNEARFAKGPEFYKNYFQHCQGMSIVRDATPATMVFPDRVYEFYKKEGLADQVKIIFIFREPISRLMSHLAMDQGDGMFQESITLSAYVKRRHHAIAYSSYGTTVKKWFSLFPRKNILVLSFHELKEDSERFLSRVLEFLEIKRHPNMQLQKLVSWTSKSRSVVPCEERKRLALTFEQENELLYDMLDSYPGPPMEQRPFPHFPEQVCA